MTQLRPQSKFLMPHVQWGVGGSAWQEEGAKPGVSDPWTEWVKSPDFLAEKTRMGLSGPDVAPKGIGCMGEVLYKQDYQLIADFGLRVRRISAPWEKIEPVEGHFDNDEIRRLLAMVVTGKLCGVETMLTFDHWLHASWFSWERIDADRVFARFVAECMKMLGEDVKYFTVLNEPTVASLFGWDHGSWPPFVKNRDRALAVLQRRIEAHCRAFDIIRKRAPLAQIGIAHALEWRDYVPIGERDMGDRELWDHWVVDQLVRRNMLDFVGLNNYFHSKPSKEGWAGHDPCTEHPVLSDFNWGMCTESLYHIVRHVWERYELPIWITEHGHAVHEIEDHRRCWHMFHSLRGLARIIAKGAKVRGYIHWSFMDNDEWKERFTKKFGIFAVDQRDPGRKRVPRRSAFLLQAIAKANGPTEEVEEKFHEFVSHPHATVA